MGCEGLAYVGVYLISEAFEQHDGFQLESELS